VEEFATGRATLDPWPDAMARGEEQNTPHGEIHRDKGQRTKDKRLFPFNGPDPGSVAALAAEGLGGCDELAEIESDPILPEGVETVEVPHFRGEDMDNHVVGIEDGPAAVRIHLAPDNVVFLLLEHVGDLLGQSPQVRFGIPGGDDEVVGDGGKGADIENSDVFGLLVVQRLAAEADEFELWVGGLFRLFFHLTIKIPFMNVTYYQVWEKKVQWPFFANSLPDLGRADFHLVRMKRVEPELGYVWPGRTGHGGGPGPLQIGEFGQGGEFLDPPPVVQLGHLVLSDDPEQGVVGVLLAEDGDGVEGETDASALDFEVGDLEARLGRDRPSNHLQPVRGAGLDGVRAEGGLGTRYEMETVERKLFQGVLRGDQMAVVNGVEASPVKS